MCDCVCVWTWVGLRFVNVGEDYLFAFIHFLSGLQECECMYVYVCVKITVLCAYVRIYDTIAFGHDSSSPLFSFSLQ